MIKINNINILITYFILINLIAFIIIKIDKYLAIKHKFRISEKTLFTLSFLGGSLGIYLSMFIFRHKTQKNKFLIGIPLILILNIIFIFKIFNIIKNI